MEWTRLEDGLGDPGRLAMSAPTLEEAAGHHAEGRTLEAEAAYKAVIQGGSAEALTAHQLLAVLLTDKGALIEALWHYERAGELGARSKELLFRRAGLLRRLKRYGDAAAVYEALIAAAPTEPEAHHLRGVCLAALGRPGDAVTSYDAAVSLETGVKAYWNNRGVALEALDRFEEAAKSFETALSIDGDYMQAHHNLGSSYLKLERPAEAKDCFDRALALNPHAAEPWSYRAVALATLEDFDAALVSAERAVEIRPNYPEAHNTRSIALRMLKRHAEALEAAQTALRLRPEFGEALNSLGSALMKLGRPEEAVDAYRRAVALRPLDGSVHLNLGMALEMTGQLPEALAAMAIAERFAPDAPEPTFSQALVHIRGGDLPAGFRLYESRWLQDGGPKLTHPLETLWLGEEPLGSRTLLVHCEQGLGDVIQFCRFASLAAPPDQLIVQVQAPLRRLMFSLGVKRLLAAGEEIPPFDVHIPMMSLPLALKLELKDVSPRSPYLSAAPVLVQHWKAKLPASPGLRIGLAWSGNPAHVDDHNRSMPFTTLRPLLSERHQFVSLQKVHRSEDLELLDQTPELLRFDDALSDFADTAALISVCDVVVAVDTSVAHLAGALGKPLFLLAPWFCDWRWMSGRDDTPWYPTATLVRQSQFGDWTTVVDAVAGHIGRLHRLTSSKN